MIKSIYNEIIVSGSIAYDEIMNFPNQFVNHFDPQKLHQINVSFVVDRLEKQLGGTATNIGYNLSLLTKKTIKLLASVGKDGQGFLDFFKANSVNIDGILFDKDLYTASGKVITDIKDNQIWGFYYGACEKAKNIDLKKYATKNSLLIISATHESAFLHFQKSAIELKLNYLYDPGMVLTWIKKKDLIEGILSSRWLIGNDYEISHILKFTELKIKDLLKKNIAVITTLGENGVNYQDRGNNLFIPGFKVKKVIDPTGAGDAWRAGFIAGIVQGSKIDEALKQGNALASFAVESYGTVNHKPTSKQIKKRIKSLVC